MARIPITLFSVIDGSPRAGCTVDLPVFKRINAGGSTTNLSAPTVTDDGAGVYHADVDDSLLLAGSTIQYVVRYSQLDAGGNTVTQYLQGELDASRPDSSVPTPAVTGLASNALTTLDVMRDALGLDSSQDSLLARLINGASDSIERYCGRKFGYVAGLVENVRGYGTMLVHVERRPVWQVTGVVVIGQAFTSDYWKIHSRQTGALWSWNAWPDTAPLDVSASPHVAAGYEDKAIQITYAGGYALASAGRLASDAPAWVASTNYTGPASTKVTNGDNVYLLKTAGAAAGSGGPTGQGTSIADGAAVWDFLCPAFPEPYDLEEACVQLATFRYRRRGKDMSAQSESIGRASRLFAGRLMGPDGIPRAIADILDLYRSVA